ncbi:MAG: sugar ABC transporter substrate-binding protein [Clostridia bacterium]|nr:sugar ABC transporter substrate-binding protein [Clostridia bacterium]
MKKLFAAILALVMMLSVVAVAEGTTDGENYRIGVFFKDSTSMFWRYIGVGCQTKADELGVEFVEYSPASYTDAAGQISMIEDAIASGIDAICVAAIDSTAIVDYLVKAEDAGIPVIVFNTLIPDFEATGRQRCFIGLDNAAASEAVMEKILADHDYSAKVVVLEGTPATQQNADRCGTAISGCEKYENVEIVASQPCNANRDQAMTVMENILQSTPDIDIVFAINDPSGLGALQAIQAAGREGIDIVAIDGTPDTCTAILAGTGFKYTADQAPFDMGAMAVQAAYDVLTGKEIEPLQRCGGTIIGPDNAQEHLDTYYPDFES